MGIRKKFLVPGDWRKPRINTAVIFCLKEDESEQMVEKFREEFLKHFVNAIVKAEDVMSLQYYEDYQPILIQFYDPAINLTGPTAHLPNFFTRFTKEGMVFSTEQVHIVFNIDS